MAVITDKITTIIIHVYIYDPELNGVDNRHANRGCGKYYTKYYN